MTRNKTLRKTKIVATVGPACDDAETLGAMVQAGMNVARLNFSHENHASHAARLRLIKRAARAGETPIATMLDTKGAQVRTGTVSEGTVLQRGAEFVLHAADILGTARGVSVSYPGMIAELHLGSEVLLDDGRIALRVTKQRPDALVCQVEQGGALGSHKGVNTPDTTLLLSGLNEANRADLRFAIEHEMDYIAASFIQRAEDVHEMRAFLREHGGGDIPIIAKIETGLGLKNLAAIVEAADGAMVARGDLGVEIGAAAVPVAQKRIIRRTVGAGKPVITATEMLDSMERNPVPTRAEASDVANAILDGSSAVMLSGETARGRFPVEAVRTMSEFALGAESSLHEYGYLQKTAPHPTEKVTEAVSQAANDVANHLLAAAILTVTESGFTSRQISKYRPRCPILAVTHVEKVARRLALNWGVTAAVDLQAQNDEEKLANIVRWAKARGILQSGDVAVATAGISNKGGSTSSIRVLPVA